MDLFKILRFRGGPRCGTVLRFSSGWRIRRITASDTELSALTLSIPHYFDAVNAAGQLDSFLPRTDGKASR